VKIIVGIMFNAIKFFHDLNIKPTQNVKNVSKGWIGLPCPFCNDKSDHLGYNLKGGYFHCWRCGGHSLFDTIQQFLNCSKFEVFKALKQYETKNSLFIPQNKESSVSSIELPKEKRFTKNEYLYLEKRGFDPFYIQKKYDVYGGGYIGRWKFRIIIPIFVNKYVVSLQGRSIEGQDPRYLFLSEEESVIPAKHTLYNIDSVTGDKIIVMEGAMSVWKMGDGFVSSMGAKLSDEQIYLLSQYKCIILFRDNDIVGKRNAEKYGNLLSSLGSHVEEIWLQDKKAADDLTEEEAKEVRSLI
jgi:hypothetical protein